MLPKAFIITVDTEGDNVWSKPRETTTENFLYLQRFQSLCERFGFKPTWLTAYEMLKDGRYVKWISEKVARGNAEVGMHLHAWNTPPHYSLTGDDLFFQPYLTEYPEDVMREKVGYITDLHLRTFGSRPRSHRGGRWAWNSTYAKILAEQGYWVDLTVVPNYCFSVNPGDPAGGGGPDFRGFPEHAYWVDLNQVAKEGASDLLELPVTVCRRYPALDALRGGSHKVDAAIRKVQRFTWIRPSGKNLSSMVRLVESCEAQRTPYIEFVLHSSELMPGGSPYFKDDKSIETLYSDLEILFARIAERYRGFTASDYYREFAGTRKACGRMVA